MYKAYKETRSVYQQLEDLKEAKKILYSSIHNNFYDPVLRNGLYLKVDKINKKIASLKYLMKKEREYNEKRKKL